MLLEWRLPEGWLLVLQETYEHQQGACVASYEVLLLDRDGWPRHSACYADHQEAIVVARAAAHVLRTRGVRV